MPPPLLKQGGDLVVSVRSGAAGPSTTHYSLNLTTLQASRVCRPACMLFGPRRHAHHRHAQLGKHSCSGVHIQHRRAALAQPTCCAINIRGVLHACVHLTCALPVAHPCVQHHGLEALLERNGKCEQLLDITTGEAGRGDGSWQQVHPSHLPCNASTALAFLQALRRAVLLHQAWGSHGACPLRPAARPLQASATCAPRYWTAPTCRLWTCGRPASAPGAQPPAPMQPKHGVACMLACLLGMLSASLPAAALPSSMHLC